MTVSPPPSRAGPSWGLCSLSQAAPRYPCLSVRVSSPPPQPSWDLGPSIKGQFHRRRSRASPSTGLLGLRRDAAGRPGYRPAAPSRLPRGSAHDDGGAQAAAGPGRGPSPPPPPTPAPPFTCRRARVRARPRGAPLPAPRNPGAPRGGHPRAAPAPPAAALPADPPLTRHGRRPRRAPHPLAPGTCSPRAGAAPRSHS